MLKILKNFKITLMTIIVEIFIVSMILFFTPNVYAQTPVQLISPVIKTESQEIRKKDTDISIIDDLKKKYSNEDVVAYLEIPGTSISKPVMQTTDNSFYLNHAEDKKFEINGSIYMDYRIDLTSSNKILIFGHSSVYDGIDKTPFNELEKYYNMDFYDKHKFITLTLKNEIRTYQIFSIYVETSDFTYMNLLFKDQSSWSRHISKLKSKSMYPTNVNIEKDDKILILQTCSNSSAYQKYERKYLLVVAKQIEAPM